VHVSFMSITIEDDTSTHSFVHDIAKAALHMDNDEVVYSALLDTAHLHH